MFDQMVENIQDDVTRMILSARVRKVQSADEFHRMNPQGSRPDRQKPGDEGRRKAHRPGEKAAGTGKTQKADADSHPGQRYGAGEQHGTGRAQRSLPLRQREKIQALLRPRRKNTVMPEKKTAKEVLPRCLFYFTATGFPGAGRACAANREPPAGPARTAA